MRGTLLIVLDSLHLLVLGKRGVGYYNWGLTKENRYGREEVYFFHAQGGQDVPSQQTGIERHFSVVLLWRQNWGPGIEWIM